jgi:hypothetical protein
VNILTEEAVWTFLGVSKLFPLVQPPQEPQAKLFVMMSMGVNRKLLTGRCYIEELMARLMLQSSEKPDEERQGHHSTGFVCLG